MNLTRNATVTPPVRHQFLPVRHNCLPKMHQCIHVKKHMIINNFKLRTSEAHFAEKYGWRGTLTSYDTLFRSRFRHEPVHRSAKPGHCSAVHVASRLHHPSETCLDGHRWHTECSTGFGTHRRTFECVCQKQTNRPVRINLLFKLDMTSSAKQTSAVEGHIRKLVFQPIHYAEV